MNKVIFVVLSVMLLLVCGISSIKIYKKYQIDHAVKIVNLETTEIEVFTEIRLKDIIKNINGTITDNPKLDTETTGEKEYTFNYVTDENIKVPYTIHYTVRDTTPPIISLPSTHTIVVNSKTKKELQKSFFCGDNYDDKPKCTLEGEYDLTKTGTYKVKLKGEDSSNNIKEHEFDLKVIEKSTSKAEGSKETSYTDYQEIVKKYKNENTKIGIDISHWQGDIDFKKVKENGVEFVYIRVGRGNGVGKEYVQDDKFIRNIEGFNKINIPVGVYFYSNANSRDDAIKEAKWIISKIKKYKVDLEIVFDWENWNYYQEYNLSFYHLTKVAESFIKTVEKEGYKGMLYSSKHYLENIWYPIEANIWLAHYTRQTTYQGKYKVWQICNDGKIDGINNLVDIDIMYIKQV